MKVCIVINEDLHHSLKVFAATKNKSISEVAESAIIAYLNILDETFDVNEIVEKMNKTENKQEMQEF